jgi:hypothetical protein
MREFHPMYPRDNEFRRKQDGLGFGHSPAVTSAQAVDTTGQCQGMIPIAKIGGRLRMHVNYSYSLRWFAIAAIIALMTLGAFFGIFEMVRHGINPQTVGLFLA